MDESLQEQRDPVLPQHVSDELSGRSSKDSWVDHRWPPIRQLLHRQRNHNLVSIKDKLYTDMAFSPEENAAMFPQGCIAKSLTHQLWMSQATFLLLLIPVI